MIRTSLRPSSLWLVVVLLAIGCSGSPPTTHYYLLQSAAVESPADGDPWISIGVLPFVVDPPYDQDRIVYRVGESSPEVGFYDYHRWAAPLARMLPAVVATAFEGIGGLAAIEPAIAGQSYPFSLSGRLLSLSEIDLPEGQRVEVRIELTLRDSAGEEIWSVSPSHSAIVSTDSVERIVTEMRSVTLAALAQTYPSLYTRMALLHAAGPPNDD